MKSVRDLLLANGQACGGKAPKAPSSLSAIENSRRGSTRSAAFPTSRRARFFRLQARSYGKIECGRASEATRMTPRNEAQISCTQLEVHICKPRKQAQSEESAERFFNETRSQVADGGTWSATSRLPQRRCAAERGAGVHVFIVRTPPGPIVRSRRHLSSTRLAREWSARKAACI